MFGEAMVAEMRAARLDLYARTKFTKDGEEIQETRAVYEELCGTRDRQSERSAQHLATVAQLGLVEMG